MRIVGRPLGNWALAGGDRGQERVMGLNMVKYLAYMYENFIMKSIVLYK
jgi:hypothetical protein